MTDNIPDWAADTPPASANSVPDWAQESPTANVTQPKKTSFLQDPTWDNLGKAASGAATEIGTDVGRGVSNIGQMVYGSDKPGALIGPSKPIITKDVPSTLGNIATLAMPFLGSPPEGELSEIGNAIPKTPPVSSKITQPQIRNVAGRVFDAADEAGGALPPEHTNSFIDSIAEQAKQPEAVNTLFGNDEFTKLSENAENLRDKSLSFSEATKIDRKLTDLIRKSVNPDGTVTSEGQQYTSIQDNLRDLMSTPGNGPGFELQNQAKDLWSQQARMSDIQKIIDNASRSNNPSTALQSGFKQLLNNGRRMQGFNEGDRQLIEKVASNPSFAAEVLRAGSSRLLNIMGISHGPVSAIASQVGTNVARNLGERMAMRPAEQLMDRLSTRNELPSLDKPYQARGGPVNKKKGGAVWKKPKSYSMLENRK